MADALLKVSSGKLNLLFKTYDQFNWKSIFAKHFTKKRKAMIVIMMVGVLLVMMIDANYHCNQFFDALGNHLSSALLTVQRS